MLIKLFAILVNLIQKYFIDPIGNEIHFFLDVNNGRQEISSVAVCDAPNLIQNDYISGLLKAV